MNLVVAQRLAISGQKPKTSVKPRARWVGSWVFAASLALALTGPGQAQVREIAPKVAHGADLRADMTGPSGLARWQGHRTGARKRFAGAVIRDGRVYAFAQRVAKGASYDGFVIPGAHLLIENVDFTSGLDLFTKLPVVMRGVTVRTGQAEHWGVLSRPEAGRFYFLWSEVGAASAAGAPSDTRKRLGVALLLKNDGAVVYRSHVTQASDGIQVHGVGSRIIETVIDALVHWKDDHNDGVQVLGRGADLSVLRSRIENPQALVACLNLNGTKALIEGNYLAGGGFSIYGGSRRNGHDRTFVARGVVVRDTIFARSPYPRGGFHGPVTYWEPTAGAGNVWQGNRYSDGAAIADPAASK
ncbi:MAG: hypothetical protein R3D67_11705 [Hyphomicrobiaceae bacterium]